MNYYLIGEKMNNISDFIRDYRMAFFMNINEEYRTIITIV